MRRRFRACAYEFLTMVTEGVVQGVHKVVIRLSFGVTLRHEVNLGIGHFATRCPMATEGDLRLILVDQQL